ncbi:hypothetical protein FHX34_10135 [Actinoplanes teichomyceticus]|uniref:Uncharacterized protein n=2 Tax=Actinoplanes teichomyceticus TaxID=1867 RepID=A0A561WMJ6_ACTTI|nr:hypothetical protein FHX34_10135 [Actinoplanes teichomyceticus]
MTAARSDFTPLMNRLMPGRSASSAVLIGVSEATTMLAGHDLAEGADEFCRGAYSGGATEDGMQSAGVVLGDVVGMSAYPAGDLPR